ncbi:MAG: M48 family metalloprotease [Burkholderiales bacterium]
MALIAACALAGDVVPFTSGEVARPASEEEERAWSSARDLDIAVVKGGLIYEDETLRRFVQGVTDRLFPEFRGRLRIRLLKSPQLNAFATADGGVFVNIGLLARFQNEAQLAAVLAHEGTHFTHRHGYRGQQSVKSSAAWASVGNALLIPVVPQLLATSSIFGFSRELEAEADRGAYLRLVQSGYDLREAPRVFEHLMRDVQAEDGKEPYFFASHPKLKDRLENMRRLTGTAVDGGDGASRTDYSRRLVQARVDNLEQELSMQRVRNALVVLEDPERLRELPPGAEYYLGEAYRLRDGTGDVDRAKSAYRDAIESAPAFAPPHRALALLQLKGGDAKGAVIGFERYLQLAPDAKDRKHVESYLRTARKRAETP